MMADLFHPLTKFTFDWEECSNIPDSTFSPSFVILGDKIYVGNLCIASNIEKKGKICVSLFDLKSWTLIDDTPLHSYALTTYKSKLVLVGGAIGNSDIATNELWLSGDGSRTWSQDLPPMPTKRTFPSAVSTEECLLVMGGYGPREKPVEIFVRGQWSSLLPLPYPMNMNYAIHNGIFFASMYPNYGAYCPVETLIEYATGVKSLPESHTAMWKMIRIKQGKLVSFHDELLSISIGGSIHVYSARSHGQCWLHIQNMNEEYYRGLGKERVGDVRGGWALPTGELVVLGSRRVPAKDGLPACTKMAVFKAPLTVSPLSSCVKKSGILKLEAAGFQLLSALETILPEFARLAGVNLEGELSAYTDYLSRYTKKELVMLILLGWSERSQAVWGSVIEMLEELALGELGQDIDVYLKTSGIRSLKKMCVSVITSALLQQKSLKPDQLEDKLPDFVSPRTKHLLTERLRVIMHPLSWYK